MGYKGVVNHKEHPSYRDTRIDVFRSLALLTIFINHIPGTLYEYITHRNFGFSDSAEVFVLLSGVSLGLSFHARLAQESLLFMVRKLWWRALQLYGAYLFTTFVTLSLFLGGFLLWRVEKLLSMNNIGLFFTQPFVAFLSTLSFGHQLGYNNILPLYIVLMLFAPFALYWGCQRKGLLLLGSFLLYLICGFYKIAPPSYPLAGKWFLNPLSWQLLFVIGLVSTLALKQGKTIPFQPFWIVLSAGYLVLSLLWVRLNWWGVVGWFGWSSPLMNFNKTFLSLPRLLHVVALATLILCLPRFCQCFHVSPQHPLAVLGKHSLPVFVTGTVFAMFGQIVKTVVTGTFFSDTLLIISGIVVQLAVAYYYEKQCSLQQFLVRKSIRL
ncbi:OpgC family protein [Bartonella machadoae]|uniref:OpgC family protein n=1 Tax=Bartonella machadoae TaxID=2893471 RepID=UPI001F4C8E0C|nr:OpgC domain-containing protein [Bartonella machadoae]UNE54003.1 OpgC domain-containing protein [Bartonella machadoae]